MPVSYSVLGDMLCSGARHLLDRRDVQRRERTAHSNAQDEAAQHTEVLRKTDRGDVPTLTIDA